jgi:hypothetical protein
VLDYYNNSISRALIALFPDVHFNISKFLFSFIFLLTFKYKSGEFLKDREKDSGFYSLIS